MQEPVIYLVDDDAAVRDALSTLIRSIGLAVRAFDHPQIFLAEYQEEDVGCILLDVRMPTVSGMAVYEHLKSQGSQLPVILITGHGDINLCRTAFRNGVADFLTKPIDDQVLIESLQKAICISITAHQKMESKAKIRSRFGRLSEREQEICDLIVEGLPNKVIAGRLSLALRTVENHRAAIFQKMEVESLAQLVRLTVELTSPVVE